MTLEPDTSTTLIREACPAKPVRALRPFTFYIIVAAVFFADQFSKFWMQRVLIWEQPWPQYASPFALTLTKNTGGAWGLLPQGNLLFIVFAAVAVFALLFAYHRMARIDLLVGGAFALALGGAMGNLLDRLRYGYVVDFFDLRLIHWPVFNIADTAISCGILLLLWHFFRSGSSEPEGNTEQENDAPDLISPR
jgi:signal peptidase II